MYKIDKQSNKIVKLEERLFSDFGFTERGHLQEWIAKNPEVLGEDLLIIQKEFSGFNETKERLDLLAIDKTGGLVIIENKLDDTGKDVTWQALKYTSYCSTLTTAQIIRLFQEYLDKYQKGGDAKEKLLDFIDMNDDDLILNDIDQRIILVANKYRKEVTSTVMWLLDNDVKIQCFRAIPYSKGDEQFLSIEQIIPLPETQEFMIDASLKEKEKQEKSVKVKEGQSLLIEFWSLLKRELLENKMNQWQNISSKPTYHFGHWRGCGYFAFVLGRKANRVELYLDQDSDKKYFDAMFEYRDIIEKSLPFGIVWERLDNRKAARIKFESNLKKEKNLGNWNTKDGWDERISWYSNSMKEFYNVIYPIWDKVYNEVRSRES